MNWIALYSLYIAMIVCDMRIEMIGVVSCGVWCDGRVCGGVCVTRRRSIWVWVLIGGYVGNVWVHAIVTELLNGTCTTLVTQVSKTYSALLRQYASEEVTNSVGIECAMPLYRWVYEWGSGYISVHVNGLAYWYHYFWCSLWICYTQISVCVSDRGLYLYGLWAYEQSAIMIVWCSIPVWFHWRACWYCKVVCKISTAAHHAILYEQSVRMSVWCSIPVWFSLVDLLVMYSGSMVLIVCGVWCVVLPHCGGQSWRGGLSSRGVLVCYLESIGYLELLVLRLELNVWI
jgi:hypothetical protein